jgi:hypothetical protein
MKNVHLIISSIIIFSVAIIYGIMPGDIWHLLFDFKVSTTDLHNVFRGIMGLYIAMVGIWCIGILKKKYWEIATISNIVFMAGLAAGRIISLITDGMPSINLAIGLALEMGLAILSYYNWRKYS